MNHWGLLIIVYLFMGGMGAGAYLTSFIANRGFLGHVPNLKYLGYMISAPIVALGTGLLVLDLGQGLRKPWLLFRLVTNFQSVMSWGTIILCCFIFIGLIRGYLAWKNKQSLKLLDYLGVILAFATAGYTGMLLAAVSAIPFWNNGFIPILFIISALSTGMSATTFLAYFIGKEPDEHRRVNLMHLILVAIELLVLFLFFTALSQGKMGAIAIQSERMLLYDKFSFAFWFFFVGIGLVGPLILYLYNYFHAANLWLRLKRFFANRKESETKNSIKNEFKYSWLCDIAILIGGFSLRCLIVLAALPLWNGLIN
ncbi:NrfD/PsrC family molybdoenzyme membrane anchor subunit [Desulfitobacterium sp. Sab5]|uniref:NrfD/PsrC family molybdoenzyme membrane anchor subunit n=1 Tax=Desulfitobacterium nosdiversum TaxID=3375356 RepID=UPI003CF49BAA